MVHKTKPSTEWERAREKKTSICNKFARQWVNCTQLFTWQESSYAKLKASGCKQSGTITIQKTSSPALYVKLWLNARDLGGNGALTTTSFKFMYSTSLATALALAWGYLLTRKNKMWTRSPLDKNGNAKEVETLPMANLPQAVVPTDPWEKQNKR